MSSYVCFCWFISVNGHDLCFFFFLFSAHYKSNLLSRVCVLWGGQAEVSMLITKTNRLLPLSEEGMSLRVVSSLQHKPVAGSNTWFCLLWLMAVNSRSVCVLLPGCTPLRWNSHSGEINTVFRSELIFQRESVAALAPPQFYWPGRWHFFVTCKPR